MNVSGCSVAVEWAISTDWLPGFQSAPYRTVCEKQVLSVVLNLPVYKRPSELSQGHVCSDDLNKIAVLVRHDYWQGGKKIY